MSADPAALRPSSTPIILDGRSGADGGPGAPEDPLLEGLNPEQREAVVYRGPALLIVAGAGSGKTRVLTHRIASLIESREAWPSQILAITFTNKAAAEMRERVESLLGQASEGMWISTFHSACVRILRREAEAFGFTQNFTIYDSADSRVLIKRIIKQLDADTLGFTVSSVSGRISKLKNELSDADTFARTANFNDPVEAMFVEIFRQYTRSLASANAFDFDDLIGQTVYLFRAFPKVAALYQRRFRHVLVDEYQDTNHAQYSLIRELTRAVAPEDVPVDTRMSTNGMGGIDGASLTVVGDSDQSIYAFRGADIRNITEFERDFPQSKVVLLEQNYRSTQNILTAANAVISNNFDRKDKKLWTSIGDGDKIIGFTGYSGHDEAQFVADEIQKLHDEGTAYSEIAVFYRTNAQTRALEEILIRSAVPYRIMGGTKFYERAEIKDAMAYLVAVANPADVLALRRILNTPKRGIGPATETALANFAESHGVTFREAMRRASELGLGPKVTQAILTLSRMLDEVALLLDPDRPEGRTSVGDLVTTLLEKSGLVQALRASKDAQDEARAENVEELVAVTKEFSRNNPEGQLVDFLTEVSLVAAADELDDSSGTVSLMTLHTAKGLEYDSVFLTGVEEDLLPHRMSANEPGGPAEERRLFYVGITRARRRLFISLAMTRAQFGEVNVAMPSRYLQEIPAELIDWKQSPGMATSRGGTQPRALNARREGGGYGGRSRSSSGFEDPALPPPPRPKTQWANTVTGQVRDNGDLELAFGDRIRHTDFGEGRVTGITGEGRKRIAEVQFDGPAGRKRLLIKIAPIEKL
ncbi:ATP-dependent helicase [Clavibacter nebraskensis]|uniref:DNA 3'-5' helicase n=4 Tax=Clavibacter nebraskensis TaxID=31963 RepID=A0AAI8ZK27_9MICO|nr:UvrD-helicase domain-containing protein [Clavibacter nebraskensis]KXU19653.1 ATP-dependent DNA helicase PcrA [Clavibacter nebraskensis]OAH17708.1 ATP-dependent DNA helicase PcrA [Clavibacter nebraskensis]QGV67574.1 UvrD-helicase domain-containing protein [Clavibacter nebraskensis]QGV70373.1 UvrD-helicase domain-containing protein [Clavibacter nebraskensis]QGV73164.1 UvrD-helicase domain-containing protein [Clavibacter nebraskensis]